MINRKSVLSMSNIEAKNFFLKSESYLNADLPSYFNFNKILKKVEKEVDGKNISDYFCKTNPPSNYEDVNYTLFYSKDGKYGWRPIELIHPALYISLVNEITKEDNWKLLINRLNKFQEHKDIDCSSLPIESDYKQRDKASQILNWWSESEQKSIELSLEFTHLTHTDISNCYGSFYTHSIPWALHEKEVAKTKEFKNNKKEIGNVIDRHIQNMQHGQTNGIPQGSVLMDFLAELILGYCDTILVEKLQVYGVSNYKILRYRDDYRIFTKNVNDSESILKVLTETLIPFGLKLNTAKTNLNNDVIVSSIKKDKYSWIMKSHNEKNSQKYLLSLYQHGLEFPNSGSLLTELTNYYKVLELKKTSVGPLVSIATEISFKNANTHPIITAVISKLLEKIDAKDEKVEIITKILNKFQSRPNTEFVEIWLQRICLALELDIEFKGSLCKAASGKEFNLWESSWITGNDLNNIFKKPEIINHDKVRTLKDVIDISEVDIFSTLYE